mmetsp:Transcript_53666/g.104940  ORF Transcript_53666/g.104940 Transcript_53666/m.104940 type:complete len:170 (-) Transcript_53666:71-580(-)
MCALSRRPSAFPPPGNWRRTPGWDLPQPRAMEGKRTEMLFVPAKVCCLSSPPLDGGAFPGVAGNQRVRMLGERDPGEGAPFLLEGPAPAFLRSPAEVRQGGPLRPSLAETGEGQTFGSELSPCKDKSKGTATSATLRSSFRTCVAEQFRAVGREADSALVSSILLLLVK